MHLRYRFRGTNKIVSFVRPLYIIINCLINFCSCYLIHSPLRISFEIHSLKTLNFAQRIFFSTSTKALSVIMLREKLASPPRGGSQHPFAISQSKVYIYIYRARYFSIFSLFPLFQRIAIPTFPSREANQQKLGKN